MAARPSEPKGERVARSDRTRAPQGIEQDAAELAAENAAAWRQWVETGPQGPIEDDGDESFPADAAR